jgi:hypothetical protein
MVSYRHTHLFRIDIIASYRECNEHQTKNKTNKSHERDTAKIPIIINTGCTATRLLIITGR